MFWVTIDDHDGTFVHAEEVVACCKTDPDRAGCMVITHAANLRSSLEPGEVKGRIEAALKLKNN